MSNKPPTEKLHITADALARVAADPNWARQRDNVKYLAEQTYDNVQVIDRTGPQPRLLFMGMWDGTLTGRRVKITANVEGTSLTLFLNTAED